MLIKNRMHPKNIYKNPPNFKELAIEFPEFRKYVKQELSGKLTIDYQDPKAVKELTLVLLKKDFNLDVEIDETRLIPRVPLCLNYILWVEDLLSSLKHDSQTFGIDLGTGCTAIYSLLAAKKGWKMLATEIDSDNFKTAQENVNRNHLEGEISVKLVSDPNQLLVGVIDENVTYDFCMCNPPFFSKTEKPQNRTSRRPKLESVASEAPVEISVEGGEINFITRLITESEKLKNQIKIYTTLVGKKSDFLHLKKVVHSISPKSFAFTEFCQGRTIRWGLAWSFLNINIKNKTQSETEKTKKNKIKPLQFTLPEDKANSIKDVFEDTKKVLNELKITFKEKVLNSDFTLCYKAYENTWSHQRRKKRLEARNTDSSKDQGETVSYKVPDDDNGDSPQAKKIKIDEENSTDDKSAIVEGVISLKKEDSSIVFEMSWIEGSKESLHQIFQHFKNHWNKVESLPQN